MGFLDHSTNNIIVDAVLTDKGRELLSRNDGSFSVAKFALGDDEIDYGVITKFGRTVGKEKIEKNTPLFEAFTKGNIGLKNKLISAANSNLIYMPIFELLNVTNSLISLTNSSTNNREKSINLEIKTTNNIQIDDDISDFIVSIELDRNFLTVKGNTPEVTRGNISFYSFASTRTSTGNFSVDFVLSVADNISDSTFSTFSVASGAYIKTFVQICGHNSGLSKNFEVRIAK